MKAKKNALEWAVFAVSGVIFIALAGYLIYAAVSQPPSARAEVAIVTGNAEQQGNMWAIPVTMINRGDETAEEVRAEIALQRDGADVEVAEVTAMFLPRKSKREAWALFRTDPRGLQVLTRAIAFKKP